MPDRSCPHARGDWIGEMGYWLCADCWQKLAQRPTRYGLGDGTGGPQDIIWQAEIAQADGITLEAFLRAMVRQYQKRTTPKIDLAAAYEAAICALADGLDPYGDPVVSWTADAARDLADDDMDQWEQVGEGNQ